MTRSETRRTTKARLTVSERLHKLAEDGRVFPDGAGNNLYAWATPALYERLADCDNKEFEDVAVPLARLEKIKEAV
jgi:hypothetical protein